MWIPRQAKILVGLAFVVVANLAYGDDSKTDSVATSATQDTVVVIGSLESCKEATAERARSLANRAFEDGAYQRAGECYLAAGEPSLADQAFLRAVPKTREDTSRKLAANLVAVKDHARQLAQAFRGR